MADNSSTSNSSSNTIAVRTLLIIVLAIAIDQGIGLVMGRLYAGTREGDFGGCINLALEQRTDVVVFGSSRAKHHYMPDVLEAATGQSFFNAGIDAQDILCHYGIEQILFDEYAPKAVVLDLNTEDIRDSGSSGSFDKLSVLLPYYARGNEALNELLLKRSKFERLKLMSRSYPYNSMLLPLVKYTLKPNSAGTIKSRGFLPYYGSDVLKIVQIESRNPQEIPLTQPKVDLFHVEILRKFVETARAHGVKVIVCLGPLWEKQGQDLANHTALLETYMSLLEEMGVPLIRIDSSTDPAFQKPEVYKDRIHLNKDGAAIFSRSLGEQLKPFLSDALLGH